MNKLIFPLTPMNQVQLDAMSKDEVSTYHKLYQKDFHLLQASFNMLRKLRSLNANCTEFSLNDIDTYNSIFSRLVICIEDMSIQLESNQNGYGWTMTGLNSRLSLSDLSDYLIKILSSNQPLRTYKTVLNYLNTEINETYMKLFDIGVDLPIYQRRYSSHPLKKNTIILFKGNDEIHAYCQDSGQIEFRNLSSNVIESLDFHDGSKYFLSALTQH